MDVIWCYAVGVRVGTWWSKSPNWLVEKQQLQLVSTSLQDSGCFPATWSPPGKSLGSIACGIWGCKTSTNLRHKYLVGGCTPLKHYPWWSSSQRSPSKSARVNVNSSRFPSSNIPPGTFKPSCFHEIWLLSPKKTICKKRIQVTVLDPDSAPAATPAPAPPARSRWTAPRWLRAEYWTWGKGRAVGQVGRSKNSMNYHEFQWELGNYILNMSSTWSSTVSKIAIWNYILLLVFILD